MKKYRVTTVICQVITALAYLALAVFLITGPFLNFATGAFGLNMPILHFGGVANLTGPFETVGEYRVSADTVDSIDLNWAAGDIIITTHDGDDIIFVESAQRALQENEKLTYQVSANILQINFRERTTGIIFGIGRRLPPKNIEIQIPQTLSDNMGFIDINTVSGSVNVDSISSQHLSCNSVSANLTISGHYRRVSVETVSADIVVRNTAENATAHANTVSGNVSLRGGYDIVTINTVSGDAMVVSSVVPETLEMTTVSGNTTIMVPAGEQISINHSSVSGRLTLDLPVSMTDRGARFTISSVSGDTHVMPVE